MDRVRAIVISDLHLGGEAPRMMNHPDELARFITQLPTRLNRDEKLELVINGDFVDFLAVLPDTRWSEAAADDAKRKIEATVRGFFEPVFRALATHVSAGHRLTILIGNHDIELVLPSTQAALLKTLEAHPHQILFVDDGRAYRIGGLLIEHGNRYDGANFNDWTGLRALASACSRNEQPPEFPETSAGSIIVEQVVNIVKPRYPFIDLLQPQGEVVAYLLVAFEPSLKYDWRKLGHVLRGRRREQIARPTDVENVAAVPLQNDPEFAAAFPDLPPLQPTDENVSVSDWLRLFAKPSKESLAEIIRNDQSISQKRLGQIQLALSRMSTDEEFAAPNGPVGAYGASAFKMIGGDIEIVTMGHTHLARNIGDEEERAQYINTGTWADIIRLPAAVLEQSAQGREQLGQYLRRLVRDGDVRAFYPTYADISIDADGHVVAARLMSAD
jgi:UDP-2,3-diacylglucosamine pyrophosphatase LpxH